ncbi:MAG: hypothetical protein Q9208_001828 [Pyrenodesmia sp. 3 TL-2023]
MSPQPKFSYSTVTGYFLQDDDTTVPQDFDYISTNFGLINRTYTSDNIQNNDQKEPRTQWQRFETEVNRLNAEADEGIVYKVLYLGRHGQGVHNVAEQRYGRAEWDRHYASLPGDLHGPWSDAHLTPLGISQALAVHAFWAHQFTHALTPAPQSYYTSPLYRCLQTANLTFQNLDLPADRPYRLIVKELLREVLGVHTCDRRSPLSFLRYEFPNCAFEAGMSEEDELWQAGHRETDGEIDVRVGRLLDDVFGADDGSFISFTSHSGAIGSLLRVLGHREFRLATGAVIPVLVRAEKRKVVVDS